MHRILVYGYGNPGRQDDGLGPALIEKLDAEDIPGVETDCNYQLQIEDAATVAAYDIVIFVDAATDCEEQFSFKELEPSDEITFTTHSISPGAVLTLCRELYSKETTAYILAIRGYEWDLQEKLSPEAENNLGEAYLFLRRKINELLI